MFRCSFDVFFIYKLCLFGLALWLFSICSRVRDLNAFLLLWLQLVWVTKEMVKNSVTGIVNVCSSLIKQIAGRNIILDVMILFVALFNLSVFGEGSLIMKLIMLLCLATC